MDIQSLSNPDSLYEMDKATISERWRTEFLQNITELGISYVEYNQRIPEEIRIVATELKREIDRTVTPRLQDALGKISMTQDRFTELYSDVRIYPRTHELQEMKIDEWEGCILDVYISFVIAVPPEDSLDSLSRIQLISLFSEEPNLTDEEIAEIGDVAFFQSHLNLETVCSILNEIRFPGFYGENFQGVALEMIIDACREKDFAAMGEASKTLGLKADCFSESDPQDPELPIELDQIEEKVPQLIAALARELGVKCVDPKKLDHGQSLYALMGFDHRLTLSLTQSLSMQFGVMSIIGGERMVTLDNAIVFAEDFIDGQEGIGENEECSDE